MARKVESGAPLAQKARMRHGNCSMTVSGYVGNKNNLPSSAIENCLGGFVRCDFHLSTMLTC